MVVHELARECALNTPDAKVITFSKNGSTFLSKRFDRIGSQRIHFASALTLLRKTDGASAADGTSYLDLVSFISSNGASPRQDLLELWRRIVFSMAVSNTDDHLRNHGFILSHDGWRLSPLYDVNPVPFGDRLAININENDNLISIDLAVEAAPYFGLSKNEANKAAREIVSIVQSKWERTAVQQGLNRASIETMRPAFSLKN